MSSACRLAAAGPQARWARPLIASAAAGVAHRLEVGGAELLQAEALPVRFGRPRPLLPDGCRRQPSPVGRHHLITRQHRHASQCRRNGFGPAVCKPAALDYPDARPARSVREASGEAAVRPRITLRVSSALETGLTAAAPATRRSNRSACRSSREVQRVEVDRVTSVPVQGRLVPAERGLSAGPAQPGVLLQVGVAFGRGERLSERRLVQMFGRASRRWA